MTHIVEIDENNIDEEKLRQAATHIKQGDLVVFPTETVYGLGVDSFNPKAVERIYAVKNRPSDNPLIMHVHEKTEISKYAEITETAQKLIDTFMPAPLTLVLKKKKIITETMSRGLDTIAIRVPKNKTARKLIELAGTPITAPSANLSGKPSPTAARHIIDDLYGKVEMIISGDDSEIGLESTVVSFDAEDRANILRSGYITREMLIKTLGSGYINDFSVEKEQSSPSAPGMKYTHYAPDAPLYIVRGSDNDIISFINKKARETVNIGVLCNNTISESLNLKQNLHIISLGEKSDLHMQAKNFFDALNKFNKTNVDIIYAAEIPRSGIGEAIMNRLEKSSGGKVIYL